MGGGFPPLAWQTADIIIPAVMTPAFPSTLIERDGGEDGPDEHVHFSCDEF